MTFFLTSFFIFWVFWRPQEWLFPWMFGWPILDIVVCLALLFLMVEYNEGRIRPVRNTPQIWLLLGLWLSAPISHMAHTYLAGMLDSIIPIFKICFFSLLLIMVMDRTPRLRFAVWLFIVMSCTMGVHAQMQERIGYGFAGAFPLYVPPIGDNPAYWRTQFFGIFGDPNDLAQFLITCIPLSFVLFRRRNFFTFLIGCLISWFLIDSMLTTGSRGGFVGLMAIVAAQVLVLLPHRAFTPLLLMGLLGALALCPFAGFALDASAHNRVVFWGLGTEMFKRNPVFGIGYDMFWIVTAQSKAAHNAFVKCYTELGTFGYWFWFGLIQLGIIGAHRVRGALKRTGNPEAGWLYRFAGQCIVAMVGFCGSAYFLSRTFVFPLFFLMAMLAVLPVIARRYLPPHQPPFFKMRKDVWVMVSVGTVASIYYIYISILLLNKAFYG